MNNNAETRTYVVRLLEFYQKRSKQIELLHYELYHPADISENEMIGALALAHGEGSGAGGHISDKTLYIAMNRPVRKPSEKMLKIKDATNKRGAQPELFTLIAVA